MEGLKIGMDMYFFSFHQYCIYNCSASIIVLNLKKYIKDIIIFLLTLLDIKSIIIVDIKMMYGLFIR